MTSNWECRSAASLRQAREGDFLIAIFPGEQPHVERAGEPGNPGETLDDADVRSGHQDGLIDILRLRIIDARRCAARSRRPPKCFRSHW